MRSWRDVLRAAFLLVVLTLLIVTLVDQGPAFGSAVGRLDAPSLAWAAVLAGLGLGAQMLSWRSLLAGTGEAPGLTAAARVYYVGQLGKYIPGSVWAVVAQAELGRDHRVSRTRSAVVALGSLAVLVVVGGAVAGAGLGAGSPGSIAAYWWALLAVPVGAVILAPPVFNRVVGLVLRVLRRPAPAPTLGGRALAASSAWALAMWILFGAHAWVLAGSLGSSRDLVSAAVTTGAFALAWVVGLLVVIAPAGAGAREAALVVALTPLLDRVDALVLALASRVLMIVGDLAWAGAASVGHAVRRRASASTPTDPGAAS